MENEKGMNLNEVHYFDMNEYIDRIKLNKNVFYHSYETGEEFDKYIKLIREYPDNVILKNLISLFYNEINFSNKMEHHIIKPEEINESNIYFDSLSMNNQRIKNIHNFAVGDGNKYDYRTKEVKVSYYHNGEEYIYWKGAQAAYIQKFMNDFIKIYNQKGVSPVDSNPFFKPALVSLLFVRIHPFSDGNGRTSRLIYDMKFTELINKIYGTNLKISPLHLSASIYMNQLRYNEILNNIYFDLEHDCNDEINKWFDFMLNMIDEQLYFMQSDNNKRNLDSLYETYIKNESVQNQQYQQAQTMKLSKLK